MMVWNGSLKHNIAVMCAYSALYCQVLSYEILLTEMSILYPCLVLQPYGVALHSILALNVTLAFSIIITGVKVYTGFQDVTARCP